MSNKIDRKLIEAFELRNAQIELLKVAKVQIREALRLGTAASKCIDQAETQSEREGYPSSLADAVMEEELTPLDEDSVVDALFEEMPKELHPNKFEGKLKKIYTNMESEGDY